MRSPNHRRSRTNNDLDASRYSPAVCKGSTPHKKRNPGEVALRVRRHRSSGPPNQGFRLQVQLNLSFIPFRPFLSLQAPLHTMRSEMMHHTTSTCPPSCLCTLEVFRLSLSKHQLPASALRAIATRGRPSSATWNFLLYTLPGTNLPLTSNVRSAENIGQRYEMPSKIAESQTPDCKIATSKTRGW